MRLPNDFRNWVSLALGVLFAYLTVYRRINGGSTFDAWLDPFVSVVNLLAFYGWRRRLRREHEANETGEKQDPHESLSR
jgi:hypothetical protein